MGAPQIVVDSSDRGIDGVRLHGLDPAVAEQDVQLARFSPRTANRLNFGPKRVSVREMGG